MIPFKKNKLKRMVYIYTFFSTILFGSVGFTPFDNFREEKDSLT